MDFDNDFDTKFKIIFTGDMGVGKTRLIQRYTRKMFNLEQEMPATIGKYKNWYFMNLKTISYYSLNFLKLFQSPKFLLSVLTFIPIGVDFHTKKVYLEDKDITIKAMIWDTSGSER